MTLSVQMTQESTAHLSAEDLVWQGPMRRADGIHHAFWRGVTFSVCNRKAFAPEEITMGTPEVMLVCPHCTRAIIAGLPREKLLELPLAALGPILSTRGYNLVQRITGIESPQVGVMVGLDYREFARTKGCGEKTLEGLKATWEALGIDLCIPKTVSKREHVSVRRQLEMEVMEARRTERARQTVEEQVRKFMTLFTLDEIRDLTLKDMGDRIGISRERVRQLFEANPVLTLLRGPGPEARRKELMSEISRRLLKGESPPDACAAIGVEYATARSWAETDPYFAQVFDLARGVRKMQQRQEEESTIKRIADYAMANNLSFKGACVALDLNYEYMVHVKNHHVAELKQESGLHAVLDPTDHIDQQVQVVRERILKEGLSLTKACEGLPANYNTFVRRLAGDTEVQAVLKATRKPRTSTEQVLQDTATARERIVKGGMNLAAACRGLITKDGAIRNRLKDDPEVRAALVGACASANRAKPVSEG